MDGYIKLHRKLLENPIVCKDGDYLSIWIYLLLNATHKECDAMFKGKRITLQPGQLITGRKSIAKQFNINESKVQRVIKKLEIEHQIEQQTSNENRLITILNWDEYQKGEQQIEQRVNNERTTDEHQVNTNKNVKNVKNVKNKTYSENFELNNAINDFIEFRKKLKKPMTDRAITLFINTLNKLSDDEKIQIEIINQSILKGWTSVYPLKEEAPKQTPKVTKTNKFNDFPQRDYSADQMLSMEQRLLNR